MRLSKVEKQHIITAISLLYIILFTYAAVSKLLDFETFRVQLGQSPMLSVYAGWLAWAVPIIELLLAGFLIFPKTRLLGLTGAFTLMVMFTTYIYIILNYASYVPCSCGGVLEKLGWTEHLIFNLTFTLLALTAIITVLHPSLNYLDLSRKTAFITLSFLTLGSTAFVTLLYNSSEKQMHQRNPFIRRFPHHPATMDKQLDIGYNSYYFAGFHKGQVYLGNTTAPLHILAVDSTLQDTSHIRIKLDKKDFPFQAVKVNILDSLFFVSDGTVPCIYRGAVKDWQAHLWMEGDSYFSLIAPIAYDSLLIRSRSAITKENALGMITKTTSVQTRIDTTLLQKQLDGIFCTDGILLYNQQRKEIIYPYYYRNQFIIADPSLQLKYRGNTIDTVAYAQIELTTVNNTTTLAAPPLMVNQNAATYDDYLFVHSKLMGIHEPKEMWGEASIIDVYNLSDHTYEFSFYLYHLKDKKVRAFIVRKNQLYALIGTKLIRYRLKGKDFHFDPQISPIP